MLPPLQTAQDPIQAIGVLNHQVKYLSQVPECSRRYKATAPTIELQQLLTCSRELTLCLAFFVSSTLWGFHLFSSKCHKVGPVNISVWQMKKQTHWQPKGTVTELSLLRKTSTLQSKHASISRPQSSSASAAFIFLGQLHPSQCFSHGWATLRLTQPWVVSMHLERHAQCFSVLVP